ncbi:MAG: NAD(P)/FAD-dependent oxidoreductase [Psychrobacter sp.]|uniref:flavin-containing monooxygenase n=1 Tax=Psychrobacter sp. TaxID=56811 RepID=UPI00264852C2|nr:NAD(P)/FAD-dependent oxidoreductase [Psychrobacter sp.]MDN5620901.1 NAD(P)/FAD-dependent oxidoreductase [Psychrobacter sp.]
MAIDNKSVDTLVVGSGQAGIAMSEHLGHLGIEHIVLEKDRIAEAWRTRRWDSLVANGPCWHDKFPNMDFPHDPDSFVPHGEVAEYFENYAKMIDAPIETGVEVQNIVKNKHKKGFSVSTNKGTLLANNIVVATGPFQKPLIPKIAPQDTSLYQIHSDHYKNPEQLPEGAVLIVGAGSSGVQIASELNSTGKKVYLSVGPHERPPRKYRDRDNVWWLGVLGTWHETTPPQRPIKGFAVSGMNGGQSVDFRKMGHEGIQLVGMTKAFTDKTVSFNDDLVDNIVSAEESYLDNLEEMDRYIDNNGLDLPKEPEAKVFMEMPECMTAPIEALDFEKDNITSIIWASGFGYDYHWLDFNIFTDNGAPIHNRGITSEPGLYFVGLPYLSGKGSSFIWGVWHDAKRIAEYIDIQRHYHRYQSSEKV